MWRRNHRACDPAFAVGKFRDDIGGAVAKIFPVSPGLVIDAAKRGEICCECVRTQNDEQNQSSHTCGTAIEKRTPGARRLPRRSRHADFPHRASRGTRIRSGRPAQGSMARPHGNREHDTVGREDACPVGKALLALVPRPPLRLVTGSPVWLRPLTGGAATCRAFDSHGRVLPPGRTRHPGLPSSRCRPPRGGHRFARSSTWLEAPCFARRNVRVVAPPSLECEGDEIVRLKDGCPPTTCWAASSNFVIVGKWPTPGTGIDKCVFEACEPGVITLNGVLFWHHDAPRIAVRPVPKV